MSLSIHIPTTSDDLINELQRENEVLRSENRNVHIQMNYILKCLEKIPKNVREKSGILDQEDFLAASSESSSVKNQRPRVK